MRHTTDFLFETPHASPRCRNRSPNLVGECRIFNAGWFIEIEMSIQPETPLDPRAWWRVDKGRWLKSEHEGRNGFTGFSRNDRDRENFHQSLFRRANVAD